jgi:hypothetical protein
MSYCCFAFWYPLPDRFMLSTDTNRTGPNKALQATAAVLGSYMIDGRHNAVVAEVSALPVAVPEPGR